LARRAGGLFVVQASARQNTVNKKKKKRVKSGPWRWCPKQLAFAPSNLERRTNWEDREKL